MQYDISTDDMYSLDEIINEELNEEDDSWEE